MTKNHPKDNPILTINPMLAQDLISRYRIRLSMVYKRPSPYYKHPSWEATEIKSHIKYLTDISKRVLP